MKDFLKKAFPMLTTAVSAVGGPIGAAAMATLGKALGVDKPDATIDDMAAAYLTATPEQRLAAEKEEHDYAAKMAALGYENAQKLEEIAAGDRDSARQREIKTGDKITPRILAAVVVCGWFAIQWFLLKHIIPSEMREIIMRSLGTLDMAIGLVLGYYFGSSAGSAAKDDTINKQAGK